jgi:segregation and condensation protein A
MAFEIKTERFDGPFDLLLDLIEKRKISINEISLAKVTDDFLSYIERHEAFPMKESAHFILVAATLLLIKSKSLLPTLDLTTEEQGDIKSLETRLKIYKIIRDAGKSIQENFGDAPMFAPAKRDFTEPVFSPGKITGESIMSTIARIVAQIPKPERLSKVIVNKVISLEEMIEKLGKRIELGLRMSFKEFTGRDKAAKVDVIVSFLAMLELVKRGVIRVEQKSSFDDIEMETDGVGVPKYS